MALDLDEVNRSQWSAPAVLAEFAQAGSTGELECWLDAGERAAIGSVASAVRGSPVLDVGVGCGRTTTLLRLLSDEYIGVDYLEPMVEACRHNHPDADIRLGDARDLNGIADKSCGLVVFSNNGLDAVDHADRQRALLEIRRTLKPGGVFVYSTHNKNGPCFWATPWHVAGSPNAHTWSGFYRLARRLLDIARAPIALPKATRNWLRLRRSVIDEDDWGVGRVEAHAFGLLIHYTTLAGAAAELLDAGMELITAYDAEYGRVLVPADDDSEVRYFHLVARRI